MATKQKLMLYTEEQITAMKQLAQVTGETESDLVRRLLHEEAQQHGIVFPLNMATREETIAKAQAARRKA